MVSLQGVISFFLITEVVFTLLLSLPLPTFLKGRIIRYISSSKFFESLKRIFVIFFVLVLVQFLESLREARSIQLQKDEIHNAGSTLGIDQLNARMFRAQRNAYMDGGVLLVALLLNVIFRDTRQRLRLQLDFETYKKQAETTMKAYIEVQGKYDSAVEALNLLRAEVADGEPPASERPTADSTGVSDRDSIEVLRRRTKQYKEQIDKAEAEKAAAVKSADELKLFLEAARKQCEGLVHEKDKLQHIIDDYNLLLGDTAKKEK
eukprot:CAMPEP_0196667338 /NCGR_PEP_ID=MMETSP1086-20130531/65021_1 /TAXON_ID=77921 /ORGANISM="Cyanoptyche  gloeocystis , Strain SAG4.97" /LENGTH=262 /DNA_ID=CAMNT_0042004661 /DNA_START=52 /DNA_END=840 /DNA_ORIENTATION=-